MGIFNSAKKDVSNANAPVNESVSDITNFAHEAGKTG